MVERLLTPQPKYRITIPQFIYKKNKGFVYVVQVGNFIKIGSTKQPKKRLVFYETFPPFMYKLIISKQVYDAVFYERALQDYFIEFQERGEWFDISIIGDGVDKLVRDYFTKIDNQVKKMKNE